MFKKLFLGFWELIKMILIALAIIIPIRYYIVQPFTVQGPSMDPTFHDREYLMVDEISYRFHEPKRGDVIVFRYPKDPQQYFIKRVIGLPGENIQIKDSEIKIFNAEKPEGFALKESYLSSQVITSSDNEEKITLDKDEYFVMGDNRTSSRDSRSFGAVNKGFFVGRVWWRGWPFSRMGFFDVIDYQK